MSQVSFNDLMKRLLSESCDISKNNDFQLIFDILVKIENLEYFPQFIEVVFGSLLSNLSINSVEDVVLCPVLSFFQKISSSSFSDVLILVKTHYNEDNFIKIQQLLQLCLHVLSGYSLTLEYVNKKGSINLRCVKSLFLTLPQVLLSSFIHCQKSEDSYGQYFSSVSDYLTLLFRKSYELSNIFYKYIDECITLDFKIEDGSESIFIQALEILYAVGEAVAILDVKTIIEQWKWLVKITNKHAHFLKDKLNISHALKFLINNLYESVNYFILTQKEITEKNRIEKLKMSSFVLKAIVKICELYKGYLSGSEDGLLRLLILLNRCTRLFRNNDSLDIERFIIVGAAPLLSHLIEDRIFLQKFSFLSENLESLSAEDAVGFLFTHFRLFKYLVCCIDELTLHNWSKIPLVSNVIILFTKSYPILDLNITIEESDVYTTLISSTAAYVITCISIDKYLEIERVLMEHLFTSRIESRIMVSDLLCLLGRLTNEEVCLQQTKFVCEVLQSNVWVGMQIPEICVIGLTAGRLFHLLSNKGQEIIEEMFAPQLYPKVWFYLNQGHVMSSNVLSEDSSLRKKRNCSPLTYVHLMESLILYNNVNDDDLLSIVNTSIEQLWNGFISYPRFENRQSDWWYYIFFIFTHCISNWIDKLDNGFIEKILNDLYELSTLKQSSIKYYICTMLKKINLRVLPDNSKTANIFINSISCNNFLIKQIAIEYFVKYNESGNEFITNKVICNPKIAYYVQDYNKKIPLCLANDINSISSMFFHNCHENVSNINNPLCKKIRRKENSEICNIEDVLSELKDCINKIKTFTDQKDLSNEEKNIINLAIFDLSSI